MSLYINIEQETINNTDYRRVIHTTKHNQVVLMSLEPGEDIPTETHDGSQFIRFEKGRGIAIINGKEYKLSDGISLNIPAGVKHYIKQTGDQPLKLYAIYSPAEHTDGLIQTRQVDYTQQIPADILQLTYSYLSDADLARACLVSKDFNRKLCNDDVWLRKIQEKFPLSKEEIDRYRGNINYISYYLYLVKYAARYYSYNLLYVGININRPDLVLIAIRGQNNKQGMKDRLNSGIPPPLSIASLKGRSEIVRILLENGADVHIENDSPIILASDEQHIETMKLLLDAGANPHAQDDRAFRYAQQEEHDGVLELLNEYANKNPNLGYGLPPMPLQQQVLYGHELPDYK